MPDLTPQEAVSAARRLYRLAMGKRFIGKVRVVTGNRHTWIRSGVLSVNPDRRNALHPGWHDIVHSLSHYCHRRLYPGQKPHAGEGTHAFLEKSMIQYVVSQGWLEGRLKREEKPKPDIKQLRQDRILARIGLWERKRKRAETALRKLRRQASYYQKKLAA